jgi:hypothetical protein
MSILQANMRSATYGTRALLTESEKPFSVACQTRRRS